MTGLHFAELAVVCGFFALFLAFNPLLILVSLVVAIKSKHSLRDIALIISGVLTAVGIIALIGRFLLDPTYSLKLSNLKETFKVPPILLLLLGITLLWFGISRFIRQRRKPYVNKATKLSDLKFPDSPRALYSFSVMKTLLSVTNIFVILYIVLNVKENQLSVSAVFLLSIWVLAIGLFPFLLMIYLHQLRPGVLMRVQQRIDLLNSENIQAIITNCLIGFALFLLIDSLTKIFF